jgi:cytochrome c-type biogenesis protein CcmH/NrfG
MDNDKKQHYERAETRRVEDRERTVRNVVVMLLIVAALVGIGVWITNAMLDQGCIDECLSEGRHNCPPLEVQPR